MNSEDEIEMSKNDTLEKQLASWDTDDPEEPIDEHGERVAYKKEIFALGGYEPSPMAH